MTEFLKMRAGLFLDPTMTSPIHLVLSPNVCQSFLDRSSLFGSSIHSDWWDPFLVVTPNALPSHVSEW